MSQALSTTGAAETVESTSFLDQVVAATRQTEPDRAQELVKTLVSEALAGTVTFDRNLGRTIDRAIDAIDAKLSSQLNAIMHHPRFLQLEGSWRGLNHLVMNSETGTSLKIRVLNASKRELNRDLTRAVEFDQSQLFKKIY
jgi:type VI secretion system protein ImpC